MPAARLIAFNLVDNLISRCAEYAELPVLSTITTLALESAEVRQFHSAAMRDTNVITAPANSPPETGGSTQRGEGVDYQLNLVD